MIIDFDKYKSDEPITIIENGISRTYTSPKISLTWVKNFQCFPHTDRITLNIVGEDVIYENLGVINNAVQRKKFE